MTLHPNRKPSSPPAASGRRRLLIWSIIVGVVVIAIVALYGIFNAIGNPSAAAGTGSYPSGQPGKGQTAPSFTLTDNTGHQVSLSDYRGKTVLLYFQEGITCQPCWDQLSSLEKSASQVKKAGVDAVLSITTDPVNQTATKAQDMNLTTPILSDPSVHVSAEYHANDFGMMGNGRDGHTFILVGPTGTIQWRVDYGGAPKYTMYVPVPTLLSDLRAGRSQ